MHTCMDIAQTCCPFHSLSSAVCFIVLRDPAFSTDVLIGQLTLSGGILPVSGAFSETLSGQLSGPFIRDRRKRRISVSELGSAQM